MCVLVSLMLHCFSSSFPVKLQNFEFYVNDNRTRSFASLLTADGTEHILRLISAVDNTLARFQLPLYYEA